jgi:hypothetical protein
MTVQPVDSNESQQQRGAALPFLLLPNRLYVWRWLKAKTASEIAQCSDTTIKRWSIRWQAEFVPGRVRQKRLQLGAPEPEPRYYGQDVQALAKNGQKFSFSSPVEVEDLELPIEDAATLMDLSRDSIERRLIPDDMPVTGSIRFKAQGAHRRCVGADLMGLLRTPPLITCAASHPNSPAQTKALTLRNNPVSPTIGLTGQSAIVLVKATVPASGTFRDTEGGFSSLFVPIAAYLPGFSLPVDDADGGKMLPQEPTSRTKGKTENTCPAGLRPFGRKKSHSTQVIEFQWDASQNPHSSLRSVTPAGRQGDEVKTADSV